MADAQTTHNEQCTGEHEQHLCFRMYQGFHLSNPDEYKALVKDAKFRCEYCSRTANREDVLCKPVKL